MYFEDLTPYSYYLPKPLEGVMNVGWLDGGKPYSASDAQPAQLVEKLTNVMQLKGATCVHVNRIRGVRSCDLCGAHSFDTVDPAGNLLVGASEIWIPRPGSGFFAAPSMLIHYMVEHRYLPPAEFCEALMAFDSTKPYSAQAEYGRLAAAAMA